MHSRTTSKRAKRCKRSAEKIGTGQKACLVPSRRKESTTRGCSNLKPESRHGAKPAKKSMPLLRQRRMHSRITSKRAKRCKRSAEKIGTGQKACLVPSRRKESTRRGCSNLKPESRHGTKPAKKIMPWLRQPRMHSRTTSKRAKRCKRSAEKIGTGQKACVVPSRRKESTRRGCSNL